MSLDEVDLDRESRRALELDELLEWLGSFAATSLGAAAIRELRPSADAARVRGELDAVEETGRRLEQGERLVPGGLPAAEPALEPLAIDGAALESKRLRELCEVLMAVVELRRRLLGFPEQDYPQLSALGLRLPDLREEIRPVMAHVDPEGGIADGASPELRRIRTAQSRVSRRLRRMLEAILQDPSAGPMIQDAFITQRNDRFVIPVRSDAPRAMHGIVHGSSSSGATRFIEPLESVELNNELVRLAEEEQEEQQRVLLRWSEALRLRIDEVRDAIRALGRADGLQARALFARDCQAVRPRVADGSAVRFAGVRHPLLDRRLREQGERCVPLSIELDPADQVLVISGPNTGGKTVVLKTFGLSVLMAQSGIPLPAIEVELPVYRQVRADIGDHQSIEADLSTYSAHIHAVVEFLDGPRPPALFLFDEIGTGTEPSEGAALAQAVLERLQAPGMTAVATTHLGALKAWAVTVEGAAAAAMEFDAESLRPTYRVLPGVAGVSAGLEIASRLGLDPAVVERARSRLGPDAVRSERYLSRLAKLTAELESKRQSLAQLEEQHEEQRRRLESRAEQDEARRRQEAERALEQTRREFRQLMKQELATIRDQRERAEAEKEMLRLEQRLGMERERRKAALSQDQGRQPAEAELKPGVRVFVRSLAREGEIKHVRGRRVEVQLGGVAFTVDPSDLRLRAPGGPREKPRRREPRTSRRGAVPMVSARTVGRELMLVGKRVDEALTELDKFLDAASLSGHDEVRVIHGYGTGRLRRAVREFLETSAHAKSWRAGGAGEGEDGATVVRLN